MKTVRIALILLSGCAASRPGESTEPRPQASQPTASRAPSASVSPAQMKRGDYAAARTLLQPQLASGTHAEVVTLRSICRQQRDAACVEKCAARLEVLDRKPIGMRE